MKLAIISHTEHYITSSGAIAGWGPTIQEINHMAPHFTEIIHIAFLHPGDPSPSALPYTQPNIQFVALEPQGGTSLKAKCSLLWKLPTTLGKIRKILKQVDVFQLRTPTGIGVYLIPWLTFFVKKKGWYKYAGNWNQKNPPLGYALQRWMLKKQRRKVTINGSWKDQPSHCYTFENPCLTVEERMNGKELIQNKSYSGPFTFCFVGRLEDAKGVFRILEAFSQLDSLEIVKGIHFIGDGEKRNFYQEFAKKQGIPATFHGFISRDRVFNIYKESHFLLLPSTASEGFPKVIAEAMNFGAIPMVSEVSSIGQYINFQNGYIIRPTTSKALACLLLEVLETSEEVLREKAGIAYKTASGFTFENYISRIVNEILERSW